MSTTHRIGTDPSKPMELCIDFQSVHAVGYRLRYQAPDEDWVVINVGTHNDDDQCFELPSLAWGTEIQARFLYADENDDQFEVELGFSQDGHEVGCNPVSIQGEGGEFGVEDIIKLVNNCEGDD